MRKKTWNFMRKKRKPEMEDETSDKENV